MMMLRWPPPPDDFLTPPPPDAATPLADAMPGRRVADISPAGMP